MGTDPYRYFRIEAREHVEGLSAGVLELEKHAGDRELVGRLLRQAHTLKGAARVVRQPEVAELSHSIEETLAAIRDGRAAADRATINGLLQLVDSIDHHVRSLGGPLERPATADEARPPGPAAPGHAPPAAAVFDTVRVGVDELDPLLHSVWEIGINVGALRQQAKALDRILESDGGRDAAGMPENVRSALLQFRRAFLSQVEKAERELLQLQDRTGRLRLLPANSLFPSLERACRDAADALGKRVEFRATGGDNRLDTHVLRGLGDALLHLVRNAVSHGIEPPDEREAAGKRGTGRVEVAVERRGNRVAFVCRDDGRGVDAEQVRRAAAARGWVPAEDDGTLSPEQAVQLLFRGGISTADAVTHHAGRGVGLDVVRETAERLDGTVEMRSTPSAGTTVLVTVPVSLESMVVLDVEVAGHRVSLPFDAVRRVVNVSDADVAHAPGGDSILSDGLPVPVVPLQRLLFPNVPPPPSAPGSPRRTLIVRSGETRAAIVVDRLLGRGTAVLKPLPAVIAGADLVLGACLDASGDPQPVLDPERLVDAARRVGGTVTSAAPALHKQRVLVVDDSLTTRMLEQSILESAGYEVDLAVSGEDALAKAKRREYGLFVVDVEMPGMSGFDFVATVKADPDLQRVPAILVTSRDAPEDRARGQAAGAAAYIVKGEFEEAAFLGTIRRLVG